MSYLSTQTKTPPLPERSPNRIRRPLLRSPEYLKQEEYWAELVPLPLFSTRPRPTSTPSHVPAMGIPVSNPAEQLFESSRPTLRPPRYGSEITRYRSPSLPGASIPEHSPPPPPPPFTATTRPRPASYPPAPTAWIIPAIPGPRHPLRRRPSPKKDTLRNMRAKESELCLQRAYDQQTSNYLNGSIFRCQKTG